ncbi:MAG: AI-2E family transporter [Patescibacteria group bacterium]
MQQSLKSLQLTLENSGQSVLSTVISIFGGVISFCVILVITFYIIVEENAVKRILRLVAPAKYQPYLTQLIYKVKDKIGLWLRGQVVLSLIVGCLVFIGMNGFGFIDPTMRQFALVLALIAFLGEFIPYLGPILSAIPAIFVAFTVSPSLALFVLIFYVVMQWLENNILVPQVMRRAVGLNPVVTIIALMIGAKIGGLIGILLAIPVATALMVITADFFERLEEN